ncbi:MAG: Gfo/Idh/MocA family oxidoreductase [Stellaceae bacterium]
MPHSTDLPSVECLRAGAAHAAAVPSEGGASAFRALMIGGNGKWASRTYRPVFDNNPDWQLTVADPVAVGAPARFITLAGDFADDNAALDAADRSQCFDLVIISTPPETHYQYIKWALGKGADVVCDKPVIALPCQFGSAVASRRLNEQYRDLCHLANRVRHRRHPARRCQVHIPMKRRQDWPFGDILGWIDQVRAVTGIGPTFFNLVFNDGAYRFPDEYDRPGAHGYRAGLGILTHTGYHYLDYLAACLYQADDPVEEVETRVAFATTAARPGTPLDRAFAKLLGRDETIISAPADVPAAELDVTVHYNIRTRSEQSCVATLTLVHNGCGRRLNPHYGLDQTHDEGRVGDLCVMIQQGTFQSVQCVVADNAEGHGEARVIRRVHPRVAGLLGIADLVIEDCPVPAGHSTAFYHRVVRRILDAVRAPAGSSQDHELSTYALARQATTMALYAAALPRDPDKTDPLSALPSSPAVRQQKLPLVA